VKLVGRIPVEPLDDERLTNIERRIVAGAADVAVRAPARESRLHFVLGFAIVAVAILAAGVIGWKARGRDTQLAVNDAPLQIRTERNSSTIDIGDAVITTDPASAYTVTRPDGGVLVAMTRGKVELEVGKRGDRAPLIVRAGETDVIVVGTRFSVDFGDGKGDVDVRVTEGVVRVLHKQQETRLAAGQAWTTRRGLVAIAELERVAAKQPQDLVEIDMGTAPEPKQTPSAPVQPAQPKANGSDVTHRPTAPSVLTGDGVARPSVRPPFDASNDPDVDLKTQIRKQHVGPALDIGEPKAAAAIARYWEIVNDKKKVGEEASAAFYSIAATQHIKLGDSASALKTIDGYLRRFVGLEGSKQYQEALWLRLRVRCLAKIDDSCKQAAMAYSLKDPDGPRGAVAERIKSAR
jgi:hypothetical protein